MQDLKWKPEAERLFFSLGKSIVDISAKLHVSRASVTNHLRKLPSFNDERNRRKALNKQNRKLLDKERKQAMRQEERYSKVTGESLAREHNMAAVILSKEKHFNE